jgi:Flp pilus assembly protein TadD
MRADRIRCLRCGITLPVAVPAQSGSLASWLARHARPVAVGGAVVLVAALLAVVWFQRPEAPAAAPTASRAPASTPAAARLDSAPAAGGATAPSLADPQALGRVAYREGDVQSAYDHYREAIERNPDDADSLSNCGQMLVRLGRPVEAVPLFERAIALDRQRWGYHFNLARACGLLNQWDRAIEEYRTALDLFPDDHVTEFNLGLALHKRGDEAAAVEHLRHAIELSPDEADFYLALGISSERLGRAADAVTAYRRYVEMAPTSPDAGKVRARADMLAAAPTAPAAAPAPPPAAPVKGGIS